MWIEPKAAAALIVEEGRETNLYFLTIASNPMPAARAMTKLIEGMTLRYSAILGSAEAGHAASLKHLWRLVYREVSTRTYAGVFRTIMIVRVIQVGRRFYSRTHAVDAQQIKAFAAELDPQPFHLDEEAARGTLFGSPQSISPRL